VQPGDLISKRYRLTRLLDVGGMGEVWAAKNELTQKNFAIKFLLPSLAERRDLLERFVREAQTAGSLNHRAIVDVFDVAQAEDGQPFIVMELLAGETLESRLDRCGRLSSIEASAFIAQVSDGLAVAHAAGIVHRDLSSENVFLARNPDGGRALPKILDFGVSKTLGPDAIDRTQTGNGAVLGSPEFMSPEQARGAEAVDARTDIWSLGIVLYQALVGTPPFRAKNYNALMVAIMTRPHRPLLEVAPSVDRELAEIVEACLVKDRTKRVQSARDLSEKLGKVARRLAGSSELAPKRRATDGLPRTEVEARSRFALGVDDLKALSNLRAKRTAMAVLGAVFGIALGVALAFTIGKAGPAPAVIVASPPRQLAPPPAPRAMDTAPRAGHTGVPDDQPDLASAIARGLGVSAKDEGRK
jgi:serine/threonine-protein kinase